MHNSNILFLTLRIFSDNRGIEKVCKIAGKSLIEIANEQTGLNVKVFSMYDEVGEADEKYIPKDKFTGFAKRKLIFVRAAVLEGRRSGVVVLSHINLLLVGFLIKLVSPTTKLVLFAHGIEVWGRLSVFRKQVLGKCSLILPVSNFTKDIMQQKFSLPGEKFLVLNNCLDPFLPAPLHSGKDTALMEAYGMSTNDFVLLTLTKLSSKEQYKGYDNVLLSLQKLREKYPAVKYLLVGRYDEIEKARLDKIIAELHLEGYVNFTGYVEDNELAKYYNLADLYVMPSKKEGFGIVFIEAMYYGVPVIAGNKDGSTDALCDGKLGMLVDPDDQDALTNEIEKVILNKSACLPDHGLLMNNFSYPVYKSRLKEIITNLNKKQPA